MATATYINESIFSIAGENVGTFRAGTAIVCQQGVDGELSTFVRVVLYDAGEDETRITVEGEGLTANLTSVLHGWGFVDYANEQGNIPKHKHQYPFDGGEQAFGGFTDAAKVARLNAMASIGASVANFLQGVNAAGNGVEKKEVLGTSKQVVVTHEAGKITFSLPQDIDETATPTHAGIILTNRNGVLIGNGSDEVSSIALAAGQIARKKLDNSGYEAVNFNLAACPDVVWGTPENGASLVFDLVAQKAKWVRLATGSGGTDIGTIMSLLGAVGGSDEESAPALHAGDHIDGGNDVIDADKLEISYSPVNYIPVDTTETDALDQLTSHLAGLEAQLLVPDPRNYCPEPFWASSNTQLTLRKGTYYFEGYRHRRKYEKRNVRSRTIASDTAITVSSYIAGGDVNASWYSVFLKNTNQTILPFIRVKSVTLDAGNTKIEIGKQDDHTIAEDGFLTANDQFNGLRLLKWSVDAYNGNVYAIADSVNQTGDYLVITGDKTVEIFEGDWLQLIPAPETDLDTAYLYLGVFRLSDTGNIIERNRKLGTWLYEDIDEVETLGVDGNLSDLPGNTLISPLVPPNAVECQISFNVSSNTTAVNSIGVYLYRGNAGVIEQKILQIHTGTADAKWFDMQTEWPISYPCILRNNFWQDSGAASLGYMIIPEFSE